ncbi:MAG: lipid-A-disaccharide synthase [Alphaproteobacteria bacterium]|nr:lipid-A-disaccharide synthase [Alphaproteobacteria bacterium]
MKQSNKLKVYLIAGEPSGDLLGSRLMRALRSKTDNNVEFFGIGGDTMEAEGLNSLFDISDLAIMGLVEVIPSIPKVLKHIKNTVEDIVKVQPDIVITIDSWSFCARVHKKLRKLKIGIPQLHYVAPQVWAWKKKRARTMYKYIDALMTLLPQEPKYFTPYHLKTIFVGHPVIESEALQADGGIFRKRFNISDNKKIVTILPGSRKNEVAKLLPVFLDSARQLLAKNNDFYFVIPTVKTVSAKVKEVVAESKLPIQVVETQEERYQAFQASEVAIAASGTVALELAICHIPHLVAYKVSALTAWIVGKIMKIQFVNLSNIMLGRLVVPELLQEQCTANIITNKTLELLSKGDLYEREMDGLAKVKDTLSNGKQTPSENAADFILEMVSKKILN